MASYCDCVLVISSGISMQLSKLAATRLAKLSPVRVSTGSPAQSASFAVVCALYGNVSKNRSASLCLAR